MNEELEAAFKAEMVGRQYGVEETRDAKAWFASGWKARAASQEAEYKAAMSLNYDNYDDTESTNNGCAVNVFSSRGCELGTKGCVVEHARKVDPILNDFNKGMK